MLNHLFEKWLFIGVHPDDVELGCGGVISRYADEKIEIDYIIVSPATEDPRNREILKELEESCKILNIVNNPIILNYPRRKLHEYRSDISQELYQLVETKIQPNLIFTTTPNDLHQDHQLIGEEVLRLFRTRSILGYEVPNSNMEFKPNFYISLSEKNVERKIEALMQYKSQYHRQYFRPEVIRSVAQSRGVQIYAHYAEAFQVMRVVLP